MLITKTSDYLQIYKFAGRSINPNWFRLIPRACPRRVRTIDKHLWVVHPELDSPVYADWIVTVQREEPPLSQIDSKISSQQRYPGSKRGSDFICVSHVPSFLRHFCRIGSSSRSHQTGDNDNWSLIGESASARSSSSSVRITPGSIAEMVPCL